MGKSIHTYTDAEYPTNTGSLSRPARFNLRFTCSARGRTHTPLIALKKEYGIKGCEADVWEEVGLLILEHHLRAIRNGDTATREFFRRQARPLPKEDHLRSLYNRLKAKFEPQLKLEV